MSTKLIAAFKEDDSEEVERLINELGDDINKWDHKGRTPLMLGCAFGQVAIVKLILEHPNVNIHLTDIDDWQAIHYAAKQGYTDLLTLLVERDAMLDGQTSDGESPLLLCCAAKQLDVGPRELSNYSEAAQLLIAVGADVNLAKNNGWTPLHTACRFLRDSIIVQSLIEHQGKINALTDVGATPLIIASEGKSKPVIEALTKHDVWLDYRQFGLAAIHKCIIECQFGCVEMLIKAGADVNLETDPGDTPLHIACQNGYSACVKMLLKAGARINTQRPDGIAPLHMAGEQGHTSCVKILINASGIDVNLQDLEGCSPLWYACLNGQLSCASLLLEASADPNLVGAKGATAVDCVCQKGHSEILKLLIDAGGELNNKIKNNVTPLLMACARGHDTCVAMLISHGADIDALDVDGDTPLTMAARNGHVKCVELLVKADADLNTQADGGVTALFVASRNGHTQCVEILLAEKCDMNIPVADRRTALMVAAEKGNVDCLQALIQAGAAVNNTQRDGSNAVYLACQRGHSNCLKALIEARADINAKEKEGTNALWIACQEGFTDCVNQLIAAGADLNVTWKNGLTALYMASKGGHVEVVKSLIDAGVNTKVVDNKLSTALHIASAKGNIECVKLLIEHSEVDAQNKYGTTALGFASMCGKAECVEVLLLAGANPTISDYDGETPIDCARRKKHTKCVEILDRHSFQVGEIIDPNAHPEDTIKPSKMSNAGKDKDVISADIKAVPPTPRHSNPGTISTMAQPSACPVQDLARQFLSTLELSEEYFDHSFDVCFCQTCHIGRGDNLYYTRGDPPKEYGLPIGWNKIGLKVPPKAAGLKVFDKWHVAFHGTSLGNVAKILETSDLLMPGDITPAGVEIRPPKNHFDDKAENPMMKPPDDHDVSKIYLSPSIKYAGLEVYAPRFRVNDKYNGRVAFQVRIRPDAYDVGGKTVRAAQIDPKFSDRELEWFTKRRGVTVLVGLLVKVEGQGEGEPSTAQLRQIARHEPVLPQDEIRGAITPVTPARSSGRLSTTSGKKGRTGSARTTSSNTASEGSSTAAKEGKDDKSKVCRLM